MATLAEFLSAQDATWNTVTRELRMGRKRTHWIWWVFPQLAVLGRSQRSRHYGIADAEETRVYLENPMLRARLVEVTELLLLHEGTPPEVILGTVDAAKVRSCLTLFEAVPGAPPLFGEALERMFDGDRCDRTVAHLAG